MTKDDVLFGYRLRLFALAGEVGVSEACRVMGVHGRPATARRCRLIVRAWRCFGRGSAGGRRCQPSSRSSSSRRSFAFALGHPGLGPRRIASRLARPEWGGLVVSPNGVYKTLCRHGINTRAKRLALIAGHRAQVEPPREPEPASAFHIRR